MTKRANRRFFVMGVAAVLLAVISGWVHQKTGVALFYYLVGFFMFAAFFLLAILGIMPWAGSFGLTYPIHNTQGYRDGYAPESEKETGPYMSQGWRRKRERMSLRALRAFGLYIEPDEKG